MRSDSPRLDHPHVPKKMRRNVQVDLRSVSPPRDERGRQRARVIGDHQVAWPQYIRQVGEAPVLDTVILEMAHEQPHTIPRNPTRLRRFVRLQLGGKLELQQT